MTNSYEGTRTEWTCCNCGTPNTDYEKLTAMPMCSECGLTYSWDDIPHDCIRFDQEQRPLRSKPVRA